jgi:hypothetical protein
MRRTAASHDIALVQGAYYLTTGLWPLIHMRSFVAVTGPKRELWLVRTVGLLATAIAIPLLRAAAARRPVGDDVAALSASTAAAFVAADVPPVVTGRISPIYLADAAVEAVFLAWWWLARRQAPATR